MTSGTSAPGGGGGGGSGSGGGGGGDAVEEVAVEGVMVVQLLDLSPSGFKVRLDALGPTV